MILFAVVAADAGEAVFEITAVEELVHHLGDDRSQIAVALPVAFLVLAEECVEVPKQTMPQRRGLRLSRAIYRGGHACVYHTAQI